MALTPAEAAGLGTTRRANTSRPTGAAAPMTYTQIAYDVADHVATITLDRPDRLNAFHGHHSARAVRGARRRRRRPRGPGGGGDRSGPGRLMSQRARPWHA